MHSIMQWHDDFSPLATPSCCPMPSAGPSSWLSKMWQDFTYKCDFIINLKIIFTSLMLNHVSLAPCLIPWFAPHFTKEHHLIYFREMKPQYLKLLRNCEAKMYFILAFDLKFCLGLEFYGGNCFHEEYIYLSILLISSVAFENSDSILFVDF